MPIRTGNGPSEETRTIAEAPLKKNRPRATRLRQQQLPAWQPILTSTTVIPTIFAIGVIFIPIGVLLYTASAGVEEKRFSYEDCNQTCHLPIVLEKDMTGPVYFYYGLENFFQNHRLYMKSRNDYQLLGDLEKVSGCNHYDMDPNGSGKVIAPCGAIANSMFSDTFRLFFDSNKEEVPWTHEGIVWEVDRTTKFKNPPIPPGKTLCQVFKERSVKPPNWKCSPCELDTENEDNNGFRNADFIVWMRTAALPDFRKPYRILKRDASVTFQNGLPKGEYHIEINNTYQVSAFSGKKFFIISTTSWAGGKNDFLGIAYITVGIICIILSVVFLAIHRKFGYYLSEMTLPLR